MEGSQTFFNLTTENYSLKGDFSVCDGGYAEGLFGFCFTIKGVKINYLTFQLKNDLIENKTLINDISAKLNISYTECLILFNRIFDFIDLASKQKINNRSEHEYAVGMDYAYITVKSENEYETVAGISLKNLGFWNRD